MALVMPPEAPMGHLEPSLFCAIPPFQRVPVGGANIVEARALGLGYLYLVSYRAYMQLGIH